MDVELGTGLLSVLGDPFQISELGLSDVWPGISNLWPPSGLIRKWWVSSSRAVETDLLTNWSTWNNSSPLWGWLRGHHLGISAHQPAAVQPDERPLTGEPGSVHSELDATGLEAPARALGFSVSPLLALLAVERNPVSGPSF